MYLRRLGPTLAAGGALGRAAYRQTTVRAKSEDTFSADELAANDGTDGRPLWISFRGAVHDVTAFAKEHPGGKFIEMAAGGDVETFWRYWHYHFHSPKVQDALQRTRIGLLAPTDRTDADAEDPYHADPPRGPAHVSYIARPYNSETDRKVLSASYITPTDALYVRNHAPVPPIADAASHRVAFVDGEHEVSMSVPELASRFASATVTSILQCAGNRAGDDARDSGPNGFKGTPFEGIDCGMVGNVQWSGVRLAELLPAMFPRLRNLTGDNLHIIFEGADGYESSTPAKMVLGDGADCLLATHMNGDALAADHGFPCRALLPGIAGARSVKWLTAIRLSETPSAAPWNAAYYRQSDDAEVQALPLQSIILQPAPRERVAAAADGTVAVQGVAYPGAGGAAIKGVEVSADDGKSWHAATLLRDEVLKDDATAPHHWLRWTARLPLGAGGGALCCRASDADGQTQPRVSTKHKGYLYNGWSRVEVTVTPSE